MLFKNYFALALLLFSALTFAQPPSYVPTQGLVAWWGLADATDASGNGNTLTPFNLTATTDRFGTANAAYTFNGSSSYLTRSTIGHNFTQAGSFTVSIWLRKPSSSGGVAIMSGTTTSLNFIWLIQCGSAAATFGTNKQQSAWFFLPATTNYGLNQWEHYIGVYTGNVMTFYRNGVLQGTLTNTHTNVSQASLPIWIGRGVSGGYFNGSLDDIGIWSRALNANEITALYQSTLSTVSFSKSSISIYPNPTQDHIHIKANSLEEYTPYQIFDDLGRIVGTSTLSNTTPEINVSNLKAGLYFLKLEGKKPAKFIKN